jgi:hypothetical protein
MKMKHYLLAALAVVASSAIATAGFWNESFPWVNSPSFCASKVNNVCVDTIPAGPTLSGLETVPADTNAVAIGGGPAMPQTVNIPVLAVGGGALTYKASLNGDTITLTNVTRQLLVDPAGTIATLTVVLPAATTLIDSQRLGICTTQIVTSLTVTAGSGSTVNNAPTALLVPVTTGGASCVEWIYRNANTTWYRVQ